MDTEKLTTNQLKTELKKTWQRYSAMKEKMAPLLSELRKRLRAPGNRNGKGWAAWIDDGHIGICVRTANRWADEYEGKKPTSGQKSGGDDEVPPLPDGLASFQVSFVLPEDEHNELMEAYKVLDEDEVPKIVRTAILKAANERRQNVQRQAAYA